MFTIRQMTEADKKKANETGRSFEQYVIEVNALLGEVSKCKSCGRKLSAKQQAFGYSRCMECA